MKAAAVLLSIVFVSSVVAYESTDTRNGKTIRPMRSAFTSAPFRQMQEQSVLTPWTSGRQVPTPLVDGTAPSIQQPYMESDQLTLDDSYQGVPMNAAPSYSCSGCCANDCCRCCPPPSVSVTVCLTDPCGCVHEVCLNVPACCADQAPTVTWRSGAFGRQVANICYACCDTSGRVIITRRGRVIVRGQIR